MLLDVILVSLFLLTLLKGWRKGLISMAMTLVGFILALVIAFHARGPITALAMKLPFAAKIAKWVSDSTNTVTGGLSSLPMFEGLANSITESVMQILSIVVVFALLSLIFGLLAQLLNGIVRVLHLGVFNRIGGCVLGSLNGYILVYIISIACLALSAIVPWLGKLTPNSFIVHNLPSPLNLFGTIGGLFK